MKNKRTLIIYQMFKETEVTDFFLDHGVTCDENIDYVFVINVPDISTDPIGFCPSEKFNNIIESVSAKVLYRDNTGRDFGGYACVLDSYLKTGLIDSYDFFVFMNQTLIGPLLPDWSKNLFHWSSIFTNLINEKDKLAGLSINCLIPREKKRDGLELPLYSLTPDGRSVFAPHVQTMLFAMDKLGLGLALDAGIFDYKSPIKEKERIILEKEIRLSEVMLQSNYNIASIQGYSQGIDFRRGNFNEAWDNPWASPSHKHARHDIGFLGSMQTHARKSREHFYKMIFVKSSPDWGKVGRNENRNFISSFTKSEKLNLTWMSTTKKH